MQKQGYQRAAMTSHFKKFSTYIRKKDSFLPTSILLSSRTKLSFRRGGQIPNEADLYTVGILDLTKVEKLYVVDGQHRVRGMQHAIYEQDRRDILNFPVPVVILDETDKYTEMNQFFIINQTQKGIRTDLADRLLKTLVTIKPEMKDEIRVSQIWRLRATELAKMMNEYEGNSPWKGLIRRPNEQKGNTIITERSFSTSLKPIIQDGSMAALSDEDVVNWLTAFWSIIAEQMQEAFETPHQFAVQKTPGVYTFHMIAPMVFGIWRTGSQDKEGLRKILGHQDVVDYFANSSAWRSGEGAHPANASGMAGFTRLADEIAEVLPEPQLPSIGRM